MTRPIATLSALVSRVVREGDLTQKVEAHGHQDEVGELASAFSRMMDDTLQAMHGTQRMTQALRGVAERTESVAGVWRV
ncbi:HAMP domain-containing protein [Corallococcus exiguus]|uniref:HAMP domain-containing protein n=1 Tax=Corallococcus TaxID=83461 RepID=UPI0013154398|nr:HAMP domain-containing protein [Corallococcus sp. AB032C]NNB92980.1 HAMP domain-containing protein [Corallococcus exiguus]NNC03612.1 HAMP domain-containing protein [Corallococcus exiguus]NPC45666.1 HAMP domain-containing protein [Corallococcus exiguus]